jgi:actinorhodin biosynthesis protein ActVIA
VSAVSAARRAHIGTQAMSASHRGAGTMKALVTGILMLVAGAQLFAQKPTLTPDDYIAIQQLVSKYAYAIDECTNRGYDYADLYVPDGTFSTSRNGKVLNTFAGRDRLAEAARGGMPDCKDVPWAGIVHMLVNHVIEPAPGGATGKVYLIAIGLDGEPGKVEAQGRYEDVYVKTPEGWRFKSRMHVLAARQAEVSRGKK